jgi:hypothetical protein
VQEFFSVEDIFLVSVKSLQKRQNHLQQSTWITQMQKIIYESMKSDVRQYLGRRSLNCRQKLMPPDGAVGNERSKKELVIGSAVC